MGYALTGKPLREHLNKIRWLFDKGVEYPGFPLHPNLIIEDAIDELRRLEPQEVPKKFGAKA